MQAIHTDKRYGTSGLVHWSGILAGGIVALALLALLYALGLGIGLSSVHLDAAGRLQSVGIFAGVWGAAVPLVALCAGGYVAGRGAGTLRMGQAMLQASVMWAVVVLGILWLGGRLISGMAGGVTEAAKGIAHTGVAALRDAGEGAEKMAKGGEGLADTMAGSFNLDIDALLQPVNQRRKQADKPMVKASELAQAARDAVMKAVQEGRFNPDQVADALVEKTGLSRQDAMTVTSAVERTYNEVKDKAQHSKNWAQQTVDDLQSRAMEVVHEQTNDVARAIARGFWGVAAALTLGLVASLTGAALAVRVQRT